MLTLHCTPEANEGHLRLRLENHHVDALSGNWRLHLNLVRGVRRVVEGPVRHLKQTGSHCLLEMAQPLAPGETLHCVLELEVAVARVSKLPLAA